MGERATGPAFQCSKVAVSQWDQRQISLYRFFLLLDHDE